MKKLKLFVLFSLLTATFSFGQKTAQDYYNSGNAKDDLQDYIGSIADYTKAIELRPDDAEAYYNRANAKFRLQDYRGAIADFTKAIELKPDFADAYNNRGLAKANLQDYRGAIADYNKAIELQPDNSQAYYNRGNAKALKDLDGACLDWSKAGELGFSGAYDLIKKYCK